MGEDRNGHIGEAELAKLLEQCRRGAEPVLDAAELHPHFAACASCREQFHDLSMLDRQVKSMRPGESTMRQGNCPEAEVWREIAGGLTPPQQTLACVEHASRCDYCGPLLRGAVSELAGLKGEVTDAERKHIASLESARAEWQQNLAQRIAGTRHSGLEPEPMPWWRRWLAAPELTGRLAMAGVSLLAVVAVGSWVVVQRHQPAAADRLLARAYTEKRTLELRFADAGYAPLRVQRGPAASFIARPAALLKAEALIAGQLTSHPEDPAWLQASARANVLEGKYDAAVESLQRALELQPKSPELLADLGTAYFQRAQSEDRQEDYGAAFEYLSRVLAQEPDNAIALFNRAIVAEHQFLYQQALEDWEHYLKLDSRSEWADEARNRAESVRSKLKEHERGAAAPLLSPDQIAGAANSDVNAEVDRRVEQYLDVAVRSWLPQAYPERGKPAAASAQRALFFLADLTNQKHRDRWLSDLLQDSSAPSFPGAVAALARAAQANRSADYTASREQAVIAARLFQASGDQAGRLRAHFEEAYSDQWTRHTDECRRNATAALVQSELLSYSWLEIQLGLEKAVCFMLGKDDWGADERISRRAMDRARENNYDGLYLRAAHFVADDQVQNGDLSGGLKSASLALQRYWSSQTLALRGYSFYDLIGSAPELVAKRPYLVMAVWREATALAESDDNPLTRAWAHSLAARAATAIHATETAEWHYVEASRLFALAPRTEATQTQILWNEIRAAGAEAHLGQFEPAIARLTRIQNQIQTRSDRHIEEVFYATLGELELRSHHAEEAEQAFRPALELAERQLSSLNSEAERIDWSKEAAPIYLGMAEAELVQGHAEHSLDYFEWYLGASSRSAKNRQSGVPVPGAVPDPTWLASRIPLLSRATVLAYAALPDGVAIWTYDNRGVNAQWVPQSDQDLQELATRFYVLASDPRSEVRALRRDSRSLYRALVAPVETRLDPGRTLVIEADNWLAEVPFEALLDSGGHYLIERTPVVRSLGQTIDASLHEETLLSKTLHALIVGSTASSQREGLIPLPDVSAEAETVASAFQSPEMLKGSSATLGLVERDLPIAAVFHFTGHSLARPNGAALMLAEASGQKSSPALLSGDQLRYLNLWNMQLAFLSTCNAESGSDGARGFNTIAEALQRAGVPHVVASRWAVDSVETRRFVKDFYRNALSGQPISEAVRQTSRNMMANPRTSHPYYWSAFSAYGRP